MTARLVAIDWGTSSCRAWLLGDCGQVLDEFANHEGILSVPDRDFDAALARHLTLLRAPEGVSVIASGMITSRNGWVETAYLPLPLDASALAGALVAHRSTLGRMVHFVTGAVRDPDGPRPDVMRGEETEIMGHLAAGGADGVFVLPGTHSKWARVQGGKLVDFQTCMTGEVFAALRDHTIIGKLVTAEPASGGGFAQGLAAGQDGGALLARLFSARSLALMGRLGGGDVADYLSGLLIGDEVAAQAQGAARVTIIGRGDLSERYRQALGAIGADPVLAAPGMARAGLWDIATRAGII